MSGDKKLNGLEYGDNYVGDSSKLYGEEFVLNKNGETEIDPITNKPIASSFMDTHGDRIFGALSEAATEKADDHEDIQREYDQMIRNQSIPDLNVETLDTASQKYAADEFSKQEQFFQEIIKQEEDEYKSAFTKLSEKLADQERLLNEITDKFNKHDPNDKEGKIKLYQRVHEEMNKLVNMSYNYGRVVEHSDTHEMVGSLSSYDTNYNPESVNKYIKEL